MLSHLGAMLSHLGVMLAILGSWWWCWRPLMLLLLLLLRHQPASKARNQQPRHLFRNSLETAKHHLISCRKWRKVIRTNKLSGGRNVPSEILLESQFDFCCSAMLLLLVAASQFDFCCSAVLLCCCCCVAAGPAVPAVPAARLLFLLFLLLYAAAAAAAAAAAGGGGGAGIRWCCCCCSCPAINQGKKPTARSTDKRPNHTEEVPRWWNHWRSNTYKYKKDPKGCKSQTLLPWRAPPCLAGVGGY